MAKPEAGAAPGAEAPFVFVVGCPRSGTTLLQRMLDAHPDLAVANDTHFVPRAVQAVAPELARGEVDDVPPERHRALIDWARSYRRFARLGLAGAAAERAAAEPTYPRFVAAVYRELAAAHGKRLGGEKTPDYVRALPLLHRLCPGTRIVHLVRDGRDVALSILEWARAGKGPGRFALWREEPLATAALWWRWQTGCGRRDGAALPPGALHEVRYEALVAEPERALAGVAGFLGLDAVEAMLAYYVGKSRARPGRSAKSAWLPPTPGLRDFAREMEPEALALVELLAGDLLAELGYRLASAPAERARPDLGARAGSCRARFEEELARRARKESGGAEEREEEEEAG